MSFLFSYEIRFTIYTLCSFLLLPLYFCLLLFSEAPYPLTTDTFAGTRTRQQAVYQINWTYLTNPGIIIPNFYTNIS